jgi:hypothetical protein
MNLSQRSALTRWATAAFAAAGAITFVATDGSSNVRRLFVALVSQAPPGVNTCNLSDGTTIYGRGLALDANQQIVCDVNISAMAGTTNYANQICPPVGIYSAPAITWGLVQRMNGSGDMFETICDGGWQSWPSSSTCAQTYGPTGCTYSLNAWGVQ